MSGREPSTPQAVVSAVPLDEHVVVRGLWRAVDVFRCLALAYAVWSAWERREEIANPTGAVVILGVLAGWTIV